MKDIFCVLIHVYARNEEIEQLKNKVQSLESRVLQLETKVGAPKDISLQCGIIAVRNLPFPKDGQSELENVKTYLSIYTATAMPAHKW